MLFDLFICHASEDKDNFVRPLAELLQKENVEVWYDEFSLKLGDSIRRSIDKGLSQSRFGVVVISPSFLKKEWTQYELDGLTEKEISGKEKVILPIWHDIEYKEVLQYSPSLANKKAALSKNGLQKIVKEIMGVIHPQGSPLISARDMLIDWGVTPPVVTDEYWIDVIEASNRANSFGATIPDNSIWGRWSFPIPPKDRDAKNWGERLAWTAMQMSWTNKADSIPISPITDPTELLDFIYKEPGLYETCLTFPNFTAEYAPQLTIRGFEGDFEEVFEKEYLISLAEGRKRRDENSNYGSALTIDKQSPECESSWALRHEYFGYYTPKQVAYEYFNGGMFGPQVSPFESFEHLIWLFSNKCKWLPERIHKCLREGMIESSNWIWGELGGSDKGGNWITNGALADKLYSLSRNKNEFSWTKKIVDDCKNRIKYSIEELDLEESVDDLFEIFVSTKMPEKWIENRKKINKKRK
jgi:hypothetical protein